MLWKDADPDVYRFDNVGEREDDEQYLTDTRTDRSNYLSGEVVTITIKTLVSIFNATQNSVKSILENNFRDEENYFNDPICFLQTIAFYIEYQARIGGSLDPKLLITLKKYTNHKLYQLCLSNLIKPVAGVKGIRYLLSKKAVKLFFYKAKLCFPPFINYGFPFFSGPVAFIFSSLLDSLNFGMFHAKLFEQLQPTFEVYHKPGMRCPSVNMEIIRCHNMLVYSKFYNEPVYERYAQQIFQTHLRIKLFKDGGINDSFKPHVTSVSNAYTALSHYYLLKINKYFQDNYIEDRLHNGREFLCSLISPSGGSFFIGRSNGYLWPYGYLLNILYDYNEKELIEKVLSNISENFISSDRLKRNSGGKTINIYYGPRSTYNMLFAAKFAEFYQRYESFK